MTAQNLRTWSILTYIISLLGEHCHFDRLRAEQQGAFALKCSPCVANRSNLAGFAKDINAMSQVRVTPTRFDHER